MWNLVLRTVLWSAGEYTDVLFTTSQREQEEQNPLNH